MEGVTTPPAATKQTDQQPEQRAAQPSTTSESGEHHAKHQRLWERNRTLNRMHRTRERVRATKGVHHAYKGAVFVVGLLCIALGLALSALPGPLTIPPVLLGLLIWSTEFEWAHRLLERFKAKAHIAWDHAKAHPIMDGLMTVAGLIAAAVFFWAVMHFGLMDKALEWFKR